MLAPSATPPSESIDELIERCLAGDERAWDRIVALHWRRVFNVAFKFVGRHDQAEDLAQEIFLKVFKALGTFDRRANFQTWLVSVSRNLCIDHYRSVRKERELMDRNVDAEDLAPASHEPDALATLERNYRRTLLHRALARLPETLRTAVLMRDIQEQSYREIAGRLDLPEGTVKSRINRGRHELARQIRRLSAEAEPRGGQPSGQPPATKPRVAPRPASASEPPRRPRAKGRPGRKRPPDKA